MSAFTKTNKILKVDEELGIVFGWGITCTIDGEKHYDRQGDHITEGGMLKAATDFMQNSAEMHEMHGGVNEGSVVFCFPLTEEVAKAFEIDCATTGLLIGVKPSEEVLAKFKSGEYTGFSIGGQYGENVQVDG